MVRIIGYMILLIIVLFLDVLYEKYVDVCLLGLLGGYFVFVYYS